LSEPITIRAATIDDVAAINALYNHEIANGTASYDEVEWPFEKRLAWFKAHEVDSQPVLVAEDSGTGEVIGFCSLTLLSDKSGYRFTRENTIIIRPDYHRRGIGRALLTALLDEARRLGLRLIVALVTSTNEGSIGLHEALGYRVTGTLENAGYKFGEWHSTVYLQLDLGEPGQR
jgi:phosphinothricin acetyltransferase